MDAVTHQKLLRYTGTLRSILLESSTEDVVRMCSAYVLSRYSQDSEKVLFMSPTKQCSFLLGLLMTTPEPIRSKLFGSQEWNRSASLLNTIFNIYAELFEPKNGEEITEEWWRIRDTMMPYFLNFFNESILASVEQIEQRVRRYLAPFDQIIKDTVGISTSEALIVTNWIAKQLQDELDIVSERNMNEREIRIKFLKNALANDWDDAQIRQGIKEIPNDSWIKIKEDMKDFLKINLDKLIQEFGKDTAQAFWVNFVSKRGDSKFTYLTEVNPAELKPIFELQPGIALCPLMNTVYSAILSLGEKVLEKNQQRNAFLKRRDNVLESEIAEFAIQMFGKPSTIIKSCFETEDLQYEHDIIVIWDRKLLIFEAKATPPIEPFRDPDKAFVRIERAFKGDRGIQKAYDQANRIRRRLTDGELVTLYNNKRELIVELSKNIFDEIYCICVTRDSFGPLATNLSLLLNKRSDDPYPWAVNILDLYSLLDVWRYFGWNAETLCRYLNQRDKLHGKVFATDELDIVGFFIKHGGLESLIEQEGDMILVPSFYSSVFDAIYLAEKGGEPVKYNPIPVVLSDLRQRIQEGKSPMDGIPLASDSWILKQGRNEQCACGSGQKYKRCCGAVIT